MTDTMRDFLKTIKKALDEDPSLIDAPVVSSHSASGEIEGAYLLSPRVVKEERADDAEMLNDVANLNIGDKYWQVSIDH